MTHSIIKKELDEKLITIFKDGGAERTETVGIMLFLAQAGVRLEMLDWIEKEQKKLQRKLTRDELFDKAVELIKKAKKE